jgi:hypothetical protein
MDDLLTRAQLVGYEPAPAAIGTVIPRAEFAETAARGEFPATFLLDLERVETADGGGTAQARVAVDWDEDTLNRLLASTEDEEIALWFDERELARAFDDVESHGLRERAAVLAIAVTAAGMSATPALARHAEVAGLGTSQSSGVTATPQASGQDSAVPMGVQRAHQLNQQISAGQTQSPSADAPAVTSTGGSGLSSGELAAIAGASAILISAAGFGLTRKHTPPVQPA